MITINDISKAVAAVITELQVPCKTCLGIFIEYDYTVCIKCDNKGWFPTHDLYKIIINIKYPLTIVLTNDMIGWMADVALDGAPLDGGETPMFDNPLDAVYAALYRSLTERKPQRRTRGRGRFISKQA